MSGLHPVYKPLFTSKKRYHLVTGGRGSGKSYAVHEFILRLTYEKGHGILFTRYTMTSAETSIIPEFKEAIQRLDVAEHFEVTSKDIINKLTGSYIWFRGIKASSNAQKANLKSLSGVTTWVVEEGEDFQDEKTFDTIDDSIRTKKHQNRVIWIQNPSTMDHFIYKRWIESTNATQTIDGHQITVSDHPDVETIHTTYLCNEENLTESWLHKARAIRASNPSWYVQNYLGGWLESAEGAIFTNWEVGKFDDNLPHCYGQDYGFSVDPTTLVKIAVNRQKMLVYVDECFYNGHGMGTDEIYQANKAHITHSRDLIIGDSAEDRLIEELRRKGLNIKPAKKGPGSIREGITSLQDYTLVITPSSHNLKKELKNYVWSDKKAGIPIDRYNHLIDPIRYAFTALVGSGRKRILGIL